MANTQMVKKERTEDEQSLERMPQSPQEVGFQGTPEPLRYVEVPARHADDNGVAVAPVCCWSETTIEEEDLQNTGDEIERSKGTTSAGSVHH